MTNFTLKEVVLSYYINRAISCTNKKLVLIYDTFSCKNSKTMR